MNKKAILNKLDEMAAAVHLGLFGEKPGLSTFLFHSIFRNEQEITNHHVLPQEHMTVDLFRRFLDYFLSKNYQFVSPADVKNALAPDKKYYGLITFDDGYYNNTLIPEILSEYKVPAVFFISTAYIIEGKKFWSDALYYFRKKQNQSDETILKEIISLKSLRINQVENYIINEFGKDALKPLSDIDRPMNAAELTEFSRHPYVHIGNHTHQHEILTNLSKEEIDQEFKTSQEALFRFTGIQPYFVSYPNGSFNNEVLGAAQQHSFSMGITTIQQKNNLPLKPNAEGQILLDRFNPVASNGELNLGKFRSSFQLKTQLKKWLQ